MSFTRYSATGMFGVPLGHGLESLDRILVPQDEIYSNIISRMTAFDLEPEELPVGYTDITPYYWTTNNTRQFLSYDGVEDRADIFIMPNVDGGIAELQDVADDGSITGKPLGEISLPRDQEAYLLVGGSPRFAGELCLHELIIYDQAL